MAVAIGNFRPRAVGEIWKLRSPESQWPAQWFNAAPKASPLTSMLKRLIAALSGRPRESATHSDGSMIATLDHFAPVPMHWFDETQLPLPDWQRIEASQPQGLDEAARHDWWTAAAGHWLQATARALDDAQAAKAGYRVRASADFLLLSALPDRSAKLFLEFCQGVQRWILRNLGEIASDEGYGKHVVMVFANEDDYYRYISHYYPEEGEFALSGGMFVHAGYGHFALYAGEMEHMQPTIAHELTHCLVAHLPIPAWLNEGLATNTEAALFPQNFNPSAQLYHPAELAAKHAAFWNADTIQEFWSGKSFLRTDDGNLLSYDLARRITGRAALGEQRFRAFVCEAHRRDAGLSAQHHLGFELADLITAMLGEGEWSPDPSRWNEGVERGQFQLR